MSVIDDILRFFGLLGDDPNVQTIAPIVNVKILDSVALTGVDKGTTLTLDALATQAGAPDSTALQNLRSMSSSLVFGWAFVSVTMSDINALIARATAADATYEAPKFDHYFEVVCPVGFDTDSLVSALDAWTDVIEYSYTVSPASDPAVTGTGNPLFKNGQQGYLSAAPDGIDAPAAWSKNADGTGLSVIDIEQGWFLAHQDLPQTIKLLEGTNQSDSFPHGAAVLGEMVGIDNTVGMVGIAPQATAQVISHGDKPPSKRDIENRLHARIASAALALDPGNVMLLEIQFQRNVGSTLTNVPVEADPYVFDVIKLSTKAQVIVVEAAGNGDADLDTFVMSMGPQKGKKTLSRSTPGDFADSGAIVVGGCTSVYPHKRWPGNTSNKGSNFGSRIDCYAWAENIVTSGWDSNKPKAKDVYWGVNLKDSVNKIAFFGGTSGASPIIAGCCLLVQHLRSLLTPKSGTGKLDPGGMRSMLSDPNNGTDSFLVTDRIGVMPDLKKIITNEFKP
jgi:hypothetical protein